MTDEDILKDREGKYGPPELFFEVYGRMTRTLDEYAEASGQELVNEGHLCAMKMVLLKVLRSTWNPAVEDNYCDGRNYFSIAELCSKDSKEGSC
jgi:hypothetical protein